MKHSKKTVGIVTTLLVLGLTAWYITGSASISQEQNVLTPVSRPVPTATVTPDPEQTYRSFPGSVRASSRVDMAFNVDGLLTQLNATEGTQVKRGEVLARLDPRDAQNAYDAAVARYEDAKKNYERSRLLMERKVTHQAKFDSLKTALDVSAAEMRTRKKALGDTVLTAPFDGLVAKRFVENNQHVKGKDTVVSLKNISQIDVVIQVPERLIAQGGTDRFNDVSVQFDAAPGEWHSASMKEYRVQPDPVTRTYEVVVSLSPPSEISVLPGMTTTVLVEQGENTLKESNSVERVFVPLRAVVGASDSSSYVWVISPQGGNPVKRVVEIGPMKKDFIEITNGLEAGELVAVSGVHSMREDMPVRPAKENREGLDR